MFTHVSPPHTENEGPGPEDSHPHPFKSYSEVPIRPGGLSFTGGAAPSKHALPPKQRDAIATLAGILLRI